MSELRVPTLAIAAEITTLDGRIFRGRIFVPASSFLHGGPMRAEEWMNSATHFFPFLPDDGEVPVILNKRDLLMIAVAAEADQPATEVVGIDRRVSVECGARRLEGHLHIDMPVHHSRVLDYLNRPESFLTLYEGGQVLLVHKRAITRVVEVRAC